MQRRSASAPLDFGMSADNDQISLVVRRRIHPELQEAFEVWLDGIIDSAARFDGHQGTQVLRPPDPAEQDYVILLRFNTRQQLSAWRDSEIGRSWLERGEAFMRRSAHVEHITGLEFWFRIPSHAASRPPPKYKMAIATVVGLYPLILFVSPRFSNALDFLAPPLNVFVTVVCMVLFMTYLIMPVVTRSMARWLFAR